jgi:hypothetical protein
VEGVLSKIEDAGQGWRGSVPSTVEDAGQGWSVY